MKLIRKFVTRWTEPERPFCPKCGWYHVAGGC